MPGQAKLEDSNVANIGGKENKDAVAAVAATAAEWKGAGNEVGLQIWRIEKFKVCHWDKRKYGQFFTGDSYIVLNTYLVEGKKAYNVHFWLGSQTTQDEMGTAAYKTVELDTLLGDLPVQFREVQGHESIEFHKLFPRIRYLDGGIESGFNHVKPKEYQPRLMHFTGNKRIRCAQVSLELKSLNAGDVFLLDNGLELIMWSGPSSKGKERRKCQEAVQEIRESRNGRPTIRYLDGDEDDEVFWTLLGGKGPIPPAIEDVDEKATPVTMHRITDESGSLVMTNIDTVSRDSLDSNDVFIVENGIHVYVWVGSGASKAERAKSMQFATNFLTSNNRPMYTPVTRVIDGFENSHFKKLFKK